MVVLEIDGSQIRNISDLQSMTAPLLTGPFNSTAEGASSILMLVSAFGDTEDLLSRLTHSFFEQDGGASTHTMHYLDQVRSFHMGLTNDLLKEDRPVVADTLSNLLVEIDWILEDGPVDAFDYTMDQILAAGPLLSSTILSQYLRSQGVRNTWVDARNLFVTDNRYGQAKIDVTKSQNLLHTEITPLLAKGWVVAPLGIGTTTENFSTTLGQEGSAASLQLAADTCSATIIQLTV